LEWGGVWRERGREGEVGGGRERERERGEGRGVFSPSIIPKRERKRKKNKTHIDVVLGVHHARVVRGDGQGAAGAQAKQDDGGRAQQFGAKGEAGVPVNGRGG